MTPVPREVLRARELLRSIEPPPRARIRVLHRVSSSPKSCLPVVVRGFVFGATMAFALTAAAVGLRWVPVRGVLARHTAGLSDVPRPRAMRARAHSHPLEAAPRASARPTPSTTAQGSTGELNPSATALSSVTPGASANRPSATEALNPSASRPSATEALTPNGARLDGSSARRTSAAANTRQPPSVPLPNASSEVTSALSEQVTSYSEAVALLPGDAARALTRLRAFRERWPASPLAHEVALRTIQALVSLGRDSEARQEARTFVMSYPNSPKVADVRELAGVTHE